VIETIYLERCSIVPVRREHGPAIWRAVEASLPELRRWMIWAVNATEKDSHAYAEGGARENAERSSFNFVIQLDDEEVAGVISLMRGERILGFLEAGYWLRSDLAGKGLMTEALRAVCDFGFEIVDLHRIELRAALDNVASRRVAEKVGFEERGILRECTFMDGRYVDAAVYDLLSP
jgi:ribosomal-protein-serine acetyltransferase